MDDYVIEPIFDNILVLPEKKANKTTTGIILPNETETPTIGEVIAVGEGKISDKVVGQLDANGKRVEGLARIPMRIKTGDRVLYKQWGTNSIKMNGKEYFLFKQEDVLAIIKNKKSPSMPVS